MANADVLCETDFMLLVGVVRVRTLVEMGEPVLFIC